MNAINYWWTFEVKEVIDFADTNIQVSGGEYKEVINKIRALKIPSLYKYDDIDEHLKLISVAEFDLDEEFEDEDSDDHLILGHGE
jgi:hypothetical protein